MKVITEYGTELSVDTSKLDFDKEFVPCLSQVTLISEDVYLEPVWIAYLYKNTNNKQVHTNMEYVSEKVFNHEPSENELIYFMAANGALPYNYYVTVEKGYRYNREYD